MKWLRKMRKMSRGERRRELATRSWSRVVTMPTTRPPMAPVSVTTAELCSTRAEGKGRRAAVSRETYRNGCKTAAEAGAEKRLRRSRRT